MMIEALLRCAFAHESGRLGEIDDVYDEIDRLLPRDRGTEFDKLLLALGFWDGWIDARNHDWKYYEGIQAADWPNLARHVAADLREDREITDEVVLDHFDSSRHINQPGWRSRIGKLLSFIRGF